MFNDYRQKREITSHSKEIIRYMSIDLGERTLREYDNLQKARHYIIDRLREQGANPVEDIYTVNNREVSNIIVEIPGYEEPDRIIMLTGHYDTVEGTPGADDNASSIAAILEIHRIISSFRFRKTIRLIIFTLEEPPFFKTPEMGSMHYAMQCKKKGETVDLMAAIDMIGFACKKCLQKFPAAVTKDKYPPYGDYLAVVSLPSMSPWVYRWKKCYNSTAKHKIYDLIGPASIPGMDLADHVSFIQNGYPAILLTDTAFYRNANYHGPGDMYETINFKFLTENIFNIMMTLKNLANQKGPLATSGETS